MDPIMQAIMQAMMAGGGKGGGSAGPGASSFAPLNILKNLKKKPEEEEVDLSSSLSPKIERGGFAGRASQYDPARIYGGLYSLYGGRRVRGGLLGE